MYDVCGKKLKSKKTWLASTFVLEVNPNGAYPDSDSMHSFGIFLSRSELLSRLDYELSIEIGEYHVISPEERSAGGCLGCGVEDHVLAHHPPRLRRTNLTCRIGLP